MIFLIWKDARECEPSLSIVVTHTDSINGKLSKHSGSIKHRLGITIVLLPIPEVACVSHFTSCWGTSLEQCLWTSHHAGY